MAKSIAQFKNELKRALTNSDGWTNVLTGLGGSKDKGKSTLVTAARILSDRELSEIYISGGIGTVVTDCVADDMTREWIWIDDKTEERKDAEKIMAELERLKAQSKFNLALKWARLYGGSIIIIGAIDNGKLEDPLNINRIQSIENLKVLDRSCIDFSQSKYNTDEKSPNFGSIESFKVKMYSPTGMEINPVIHHSRVLMFNGKTIPEGMRGNSTATLEQLFWGMSEIQFLFEKMASYEGVGGSITSLLQEFSVGKFSIKGLTALMASGKEDIVVQRMMLIGMMKSTINSIMLDEGESYSRETISLSGIPEILDRYMMDVSLACRIPVTKLFGRSPAGMNATGEGDQDNYYDDIKTKQGLSLKPQIEQLVNIIKKKEKITAPTEITFNSLYQLDEKETAEIAEIEERTKKTKAEKEAVLVNAGIVTSESIYDAEYAEQYKFKPLDEE